MGSTLMRSLRISCFLTEGPFGVLPLAYFYLPKSARAHLLLQSDKVNHCYSGPISVDPIRPQPRIVQTSESKEQT